MLRALFALSALLLVATAVLAEDRCEPNPVFKPFAGETPESCEQARFSELELWRWRQAGKPDNGTEPFKVEGEYWYFLNGLTRDARGRMPGKLEVRRNFENAVRRAGGDVLNLESGKVTFRLETASGTFFGESGCSRGGESCEAVSHKLIRVAEFTQSVGVVGAVDSARPASAGTNTLAHSTTVPCNCTCDCQPQAAPAGTMNCTCQCQCDKTGGQTARPRIGLPGAGASGNRPAVRAAFPTPAEPTLFPSQGTRNMAVVIAGEGVGQAEAVLFGAAAADILEKTSERIHVRVPAIPSEAVRVHLQMPTGRVTLRQPFQVYQAPDQSASVRSPPCPQPYGDLAGLALEIAALRPQSVQPGQLLTLAVPGIGALRDRLQRTADGQAGASAGAGSMTDALAGMGQGAKHIGVAFTHEPNAPSQDAPPQDIQDWLDGISGDNRSPARPIGKAESITRNELTVRVPNRAVSGPVAIVIRQSIPLNWLEYDTLSCRASGPALLVAPPR